MVKSLQTDMVKDIYNEKFTNLFTFSIIKAIILESYKSNIKRGHIKLKTK